jgi:ribose-phosphate pyrophosphokinase
MRALDKKDQPRVPITARLVADMIEVAGADRYITLDLHAGQIQGFFTIPGDVLTAFHIEVDYLNSIRSQMYQPVVVTADLGFAKKGRNIAVDIHAPMAFIEKRRKANDSNAEALTIIGVFSTGMLSWSMMRLTLVGQSSRQWTC